MAAYFRSVKPLALAGGLFLTSGAVYLTRRTGTVQCSPSAAITFYQYQTCPFCSKTRAALDYYGINYKTVEVNPLFRREIKFSEYKKVPILKFGDTQQINDSSLIVSVLRSCMIQRANVDEVLQMYPEVTYFDEKNREVIERANKYFLMYGEIPTTTETYGKLREEREWRQWVDTHLVKTFSPNIYRTLSESVRSFKHITTVGNFSAFGRIFGQYIGGMAMYVLGKRLKKKYDLKEDVRQSLYECCDQWITAVGEHRTFMGGDQPNLADLAVYGALSAMEGMDAFNDVMNNTSISSWYYSVQHQVTNHNGHTDAISFIINNN